MKSSRDMYSVVASTGSVPSTTAVTAACTAAVCASVLTALFSIASRSAEGGIARWKLWLPAPFVLNVLAEVREMDASEEPVGRSVVKMVLVLVLVAVAPYVAARLKFWVR